MFTWSHQLVVRLLTIEFFLSFQKRVCQFSRFVIILLIYSVHPDTLKKKDYLIISKYASYSRGLIL